MLGNPPVPINIAMPHHPVGRVQGSAGLSETNIWQDSRDVDIAKGANMTPTLELDQPQLRDS